MDNPIMPMWFELAVLLPLVLHLVLLVSALISVGRSRHTATAKGVWVLITLAVPVLGPLLWFFMGRRAISGVEV